MRLGYLIKKICDYNLDCSDCVLECEGTTMTPYEEDPDVIEKCVELNMIRIKEDD